jgi:signal transduction histidine kinase
LFGTRLPRYHWWILITNTIFWLLVLFIGDTHEMLQSVVELSALSVAFIPLILLLPVIVSAMRKNRDGAYILGIGMGICVLAWTLEIIMLSMGLRYAARPLLIAIFIRSGVYIAIPLSLSVLLARRTARLAQRSAEQNEHLEENVQKRTEALSQANALLQEQNRQLEEVNQEKNEIIGIVSHDLKNPIGAIRGMAELLQIASIEKEQIPMLATQIVGVSDRMLGLVKNLLEVNRLEAGEMQVNISEVDVLPFVQASIAQYRPQAEAKHISIILESALQDSRVWADEQALMQVVDNLISNAVKYSPQGKKVRIRMRNHSSSDGSTNAPMTNTPMTNDQYIRLEVQDEGPGISSEDMKKLFRKFARLSARPTGGEHSTGLGLSIVKKMVEAMQGRVWCESELGKGATFIVELPKG